MGEAEQPANVQTGAPSVTTLNEKVKQHFKDIEAFRPVQCHGEVTNLNTDDSGVYFTLVDGECRIRCVCWHTYYQQIDVTISERMEIALDGKIGYYPQGGRLQLYANDLTVIGTGEQTTATEQLEADIGARGWFDDTHKTSLPQVPETVGVVTSHNGDARYDLTEAIHDSAPAVDVIIQHATVQGSNAPQSLADGIQALDQDDNVDVMIVGRGGGSSTDLQAFNSELVAEAIHDTTTPVVSAVGHTEDQLIADRVADEAVTTPREAGKTVINERGRIWGQLEHLEDDLDNAYARLEQEHDHEQHLDQAVANAQATDGHMTTVYKAAIAGLIIVVLILIGILLL